MGTAIRKYSSESSDGTGPGRGAGAGGIPARYHTTDICDGCAQGHNGMNYILASREAICDMVEVHGNVFPWDGMVLASSCDKSVPAHLKAMARLNIPSIFIPGGSMRPGPNMTTSLLAGDISLRQKREGGDFRRRNPGLQADGLPVLGSVRLFGNSQHHAGVWQRP